MPRLRATSRAGLRREVSGSWTRRHVIGLCFAVLVAGCSRRPRAEPLEGQRWTHPQAGFSLVVPEGWSARLSPVGLSLLRERPHHGGFPTLVVRQLATGGAASLQFDGKAWQKPPLDFEYRYQRWSNTRGRGHRLEALVRVQGRRLFAEAAVWDPGEAIDQDFFNDEVWPILLTLRAE